MACRRATCPFHPAVGYASRVYWRVLMHQSVCDPKAGHRRRKDEHVHRGTGPIDGLIEYVRNGRKRTKSAHVKYRPADQRDGEKHPCDRKARKLTYVSGRSVTKVSIDS